MNEIKIYHSVWKNAITIIACLAMAGLGIFVGIREGKFSWIVWMAIVIFGLGGLFMAYMVIKDKIAHRPFLIITDEYVRMNAPKARLNEIIEVLPGLKSPTIIPLADDEWCSVHTVLDQKRFWEIIGKLKELGAQGILVTPIEKMIL